ncbi:hypothetical protein AKO1_002757 [Acrasis kona]|uniref:Uncharacterized protein n=1 Tax=Acrasis kona TaxID=1008807 RepID=A0AAW2YMM0_9EUKA
MVCWLYDVARAFGLNGQIIVHRQAVGGRVERKRVRELFPVLGANWIVKIKMSSPSARRITLFVTFVSAHQDYHMMEFISGWRRRTFNSLTLLDSGFGAHGHNANVNYPGIAVLVPLQPSTHSVLSIYRSNAIIAECMWTMKFCDNTPSVFPNALEPDLIAWLRVASNNAQYRSING